MKFNNTILMLIILLTSYSSTAQTKEDYLLKSKHQKTAAFIMLGTGFGLAVSGSVIETHRFVDLVGLHPSDKTNWGWLLMILGTEGEIGSIHLFVEASRNRHRAMSLSFTSQPLPELVKNMAGNKPVPSISLHLKL